MLGKSWKKILLLVLIVACLFNIVTKLIQRNSLKEELKATLNKSSKYVILCFSFCFSSNFKKTSAVKKQSASALCLFSGIFNPSVLAKVSNL